jgi:TPR repeat protein
VPGQIQQALIEHCLFVVRSSDLHSNVNVRRCAHILGQCYSSGFGVDADLKKSNEYLIMAADTNSFFSWGLKHRVIASWNADEQTVPLDQKTRVQWYLDVLLPHRNTL